MHITSSSLTNSLFHDQKTTKDQDQDFEKRVSRRLETKTQVSRTRSEHFCIV